MTCHVTQLVKGKKNIHSEASVVSFKTSPLTYTSPEAISGTKLRRGQYSDPLGVMS